MSIGNWYRVGTVAVTNGSVNVVGTGTFWTSQCNPGDRFTVDGQTWYEINSITDDTHLALLSVGGSGAYAGTTAANSAYAIDRNFTNNLNANIAASVASLVAQYQANSNGPLSGLFGNGAAATPGIAFLNEASTGLFHPAAGIAALAVQGAEFLRAVGTAGGVPAMLGIGQTAPANALDLLCTSNALYGARIQNGSAGTAARAALQLGNTSGATHVLNLGVNGTGFTANGVLAPSRGFVEGPNGVDFASGVTAGNAYTWGVGAAYASKMALDFAGNLSLTAGGKLGIGMAPVNVLDITLNQNAGSQVSVLNNSAGTAAQTTYLLNTVSASGGIALCGTGFTTSGLFKANQTTVYGNGGPLALGTVGSQPVIFGVGNAAVAQFDVSGKLLIGSTTPGAWLVVQPANTLTARSALFNSGDGSNIMYTDTGDQSFTTTGNSTAHTAIYLAKHTVSGRSLTSTGTNNASGADYAEYRELIPVLYGLVAKGALLGYDASGLMTNVFADVVGRILPKSTAPSYVGGDTWGTEAAICATYGIAAPGAAPALVVEPGANATADETAAYDAYIAELAAWSARSAAFETAMEAERVKWDRIALCGVVPVNIAGLTAADAGKYLVPCAASDGTITATAVAKGDLTLGQYIDSFGTIEKIGADGRPLVNVKNG